ncbi:M15 family metallopeptidase [Pandoraea sp. NPDC090278]|uniref:M15 family metallopeptidase n=1 Tax=Pandoraea sp. NPDC090278 TaxID=3364391 RepID=UPI00383AA2C6
MRYMIGVVTATILLATLAVVTHAHTAGPSFPTIEPITDRDCEIMAQNYTWQPDNPVACKRLRAILFSYSSDEMLKTDGKIVVLDLIAPEVAKLMHDLSERGFYIKKSRPLEEYKGDDIASMNDNNTSAFNGRRTVTSSGWSLHAYGVAIDLNPLQNPVIYPNQQEDPLGSIAHGMVVPGKPGTALIRPAASSNANNNYLNRNIYRARPDEDGFYRRGMAESVADLFAYYGFLTWGGYWNDPLDYQHFEVGPRSFVERLYAMDSPASTNPINGRVRFIQYVDTYRRCLDANRHNASDASQVRAYCARETIAQFSME